MKTQTISQCVRLKISVIILLWAQYTFYIIYYIFVFFQVLCCGGMGSSGSLRGKSTIVKYITDMIRENNNSMRQACLTHKLFCDLCAIWSMIPKLTNFYCPPYC